MVRQNLAADRMVVGGRLVIDGVDDFANVLKLVDEHFRSAGELANSGTTGPLALGHCRVTR